LADVGIKKGFTMIADALLEALARAPMPGRHHRIALGLVRLIYGYRDERTGHPYKQRQLGAAEIGHVIAMDPSAVRLILRDLERWGVITRTGGGQGRKPTLAIVKDWERWSIGDTHDAARRRNLGGTPPRWEATQVGGDPGGRPPDLMGGRRPRETGGTPPAAIDSINNSIDLHVTAPGTPDVDGFRDLLTGDIPLGLNGKTWPSSGAWFEHHREIVIGEAQLASGELEGPKFLGAFRATIMRYWQSKTPKPRGGRRSKPAPASARAAMGWENG